MGVRAAIVATVAGCALALGVAVPATAAAQPPPYRANDYAGGQALSILPPGENGLVNALQLPAAEAGKRPFASQDQLGPYADLLYGAPSLTDSKLGRYFNDESFGVRPGDVTRVERPSKTVPVTIYRDRHDVPHIYGKTFPAAAFGAGYAQAEDRLFLMDVLRHYGAGTLSSFIGPSCADEQMDHDQLLGGAYTPAQAQAQVDALPREYGAQGATTRDAIHAFVQGVNAYIAKARLDPRLLPADYAAAVGPPTPWHDSDVVYVASLIGGIFGKGGGGEVANARLLQYLRGKLGDAAGTKAFGEFKEQNDPSAPTTINRTFPYEIPGKVDPAKTALPDDAGAPLTGGPTNTTPGCDLTSPNKTVGQITQAMRSLPKAMSNALLVDGQHSASGHPLAVFGPQVSYFAPEILMQEDIHAPGYQAEGASFPGTGLVELGRGEDYAWSATSAGNDIIDQRLEKVCDPGGGPPPAQGDHYLFDGRCLPMQVEHFRELAFTKPGGLGLPTYIDHEIRRTRHGIVQGYTTAAHGEPVAVVTQRSTYTHDIDSAVGFLRWGQPALTHDASSWFKGAEQIGFTFNWFYVDDRDIAYYNSGKNPIRPADVDPNLPTWGTGNAEWQGFQPSAGHPHEIDPAQGFLDSWNNKQAPGFSASDAQYGYGPVFRVQLLTAQIARQLTGHGGRISRSNLVQAMETAASQDLDGVTVARSLLSTVDPSSEPPGVQAMLTQLRRWVDSGSHRLKARPDDTQYADHAAVAIMDELEPDLIRAIFDRLYAAGGTGSQGSNGGATAESYTVLPMQFVNTPNSGGAHLGSAYDGGFEGYLLKVLGQVRGDPVVDPFGAEVTRELCAGGLATCPQSLDGALAKAYDALVKANGNSTDVASWTQDTATKAAGMTMPAYDAIHFRTVGIVGQPPIDWQNRPTFQQVVSFPAHRSSGTAPIGGGSGPTGAGAAGPGGSGAGGSGAGGPAPSSGPPRGGVETGAGGAAPGPPTAGALAAAALAALLGIAALTGAARRR